MRHSLHLIAQAYLQTKGVLGDLKALGFSPVSVCEDSREIKEGDLFLAYQGKRADGRKFIAQAIQNGAAFVCFEEGDFAWNEAHLIPHLAVANLRDLAAPLAHLILGNPSEKICVTAITGTNGKTSIAEWLQALLPDCAAIGTLGARYKNAILETGLTTPGAVLLARSFADFAQKGAKNCALEASSIGIEEGRLDATHIDTAIFTNLTRDHLDYHQSMEAYGLAKQKLFGWENLRLAIVNLDDAFAETLIKTTSATKIIGYSQTRQTRQTHQEAKTKVLTNEIHANNIVETIDGLRFILKTSQGQIEIQTSLIGRFNVSNLLAVAAVLIEKGASLEEVQESFKILQSPDGRMQSIGGKNAPLVVVDYAHTPDALQNALQAMREVANARSGKLWVVFGCGGGRDAGKRPLMGKIADALADKIILTSDNPRHENPHLIMGEIFTKAPLAMQVESRAAAIFYSVINAAKEDVILVAGKGHENYQEILQVKHPFNDAKEVSKALQARKENQ